MFSLRKGKQVSRRKLITGGAVVAAGSAALIAGTGGASAAPGPVEMMVARQEIEYRRRLYGKATDLLGVNTPDAIAEGTAIYHEIFTEDANIVAGSLTGVGPDDWAEKVNNALAGFTATQHMLGTQLVTALDLGGYIPGHGPTGATAELQSYLNALHESEPGGNILIVRGTYFDKLRWVPGKGWQIYDMNLVFTSVETREHTPAAS